MAKQRKQKQKDSNRAPISSAPGGCRFHNSCCATVRGQKLCLAVDVARRRIHGYTELTVVAPKSGVIGLHARGLHVDEVLVDGVSTPFELLPHQPLQEHDSQNGEHTASSAAEAADICYQKYVTTLEEEMVPELLIRPGQASTPMEASTPVASSQSQGISEAAADNGGAPPSTPVEISSAETKPAETANGLAAVAPVQEQQCNVVRVVYWVDEPLAGAHFKGNVFHTNNQLRRARCWFPCVDSVSERSSYSMEITVESEYIAVSNGKLLYQVYSKDGPHLKTYAYSMIIPIAANHISLVVAPLVVLPDRSNVMISHMCMPGDALRLQCTVSFFQLLFSTYEEYLGAPFPFGSYKQVFIDSECSISSASSGASMVILSSHLLVDERIIDQALLTQVKLAHMLAHQWFGVYITPETPADAWLLEGLAGYLCDQFVKRYMGNNEARFHRFRANEAVCKVDVEGGPVLSWPFVAGSDLYGTETLGALGEIRSWKATAVVQMLEKQMGPESFKKILQRIILRAQDPVRHLRSLSTKEFRHFANKLGNLERPYLKEFFPRWVESAGCPRLRMGFLYSKRRNMLEVAVHRESTASGGHLSKDKVSGCKPLTPDLGWPGMMSIRIHELDGMYDHPSLPMGGEVHQLLDIQCHSKLAGRRVAKPKKGSKDATDEHAENGGADIRHSLESPLLWLRADPQMEYIAEIHLSQPEQMWINQLEKDRDVVGQLQAIAALVALPRPSYAVATALNNTLIDSKVYCRVRIEAASGLASTASEANSWVGLSYLIKFYKSCRYDPEILLPRTNDFHDLAEYLVLEAVPEAVAAVRGSDGKSPVEATDFILHILKHNDNSGNHYSDVFWLASVIEAIGGFEFGPQVFEMLSTMKEDLRVVRIYFAICEDMECASSGSTAGAWLCSVFVSNMITRHARLSLGLLPTRAADWFVGQFLERNIQTLSKFLKQIDHFLKYDRLMPSYNGVLTISCIRTLTRLGMKFSQLLPAERLKQLLRPFGDARTTGQQVRVTAMQSMLEIEASAKGLDSAVELALQFVGMDPSLMVQSKLMKHMVDMSALGRGAPLSNRTLAALLRIIESNCSFSNVLLRHHLFSLVQIQAGRSASLYRTGNKVVLPIPTPPKAPQSTARPQSKPPPPKEGKPKSAPKSTAGAATSKGKAEHAESLRIRIVSLRPDVVPKVEQPVTSAASSGGKELPAKGDVRGGKVGKVKLRLKPSSLSGGGGASPMEPSASAGSVERSAATAADPSPAPVLQVSAKAELMPEESAHSRPGSQKGVELIRRVKEEIATPVPAEETVESADDSVMRGESAASVGAQVAEAAAGSSLGIGGINESRSQKDVTVKHENGVVSPYDGAPQTTQEMGHAAAGPGTSDLSDRKQSAAENAATTSASQGKDGETEKDHKSRKDRREKKHRKEKKRKHSGRDGEDPHSQEKRKRSKENDVEYQERKRKRKDEKRRQKESLKASSAKASSAEKSNTVKADTESVGLPPPASIVPPKVEPGPSSKFRLKFKHFGGTSAG